MHAVTASPGLTAAWALEDPGPADGGDVTTMLLHTAELERRRRPQSKTFFVPWATFQDNQPTNTHAPGECRRLVPGPVPRRRKGAALEPSQLGPAHPAFVHWAVREERGQIYCAPEVLEITNRYNENDGVSIPVRELAFGAHSSPHSVNFE